MYAAKKKFGQNFLCDQNIINAIVRSIQPNTNDNIVEIGPGHGALTIPLLEQTSKLDVIEIDKDIIPSLINNCENKGKLNLHSRDVLKFDFNELIDTLGKLRIVGNLPYNISTPLLFKLIKYNHSIVDMHIMLQKEVAERIVAKTNSSNYGRLSVMMQCYFEAEVLFIVKANSFKPAPKVESAVIRLKPLAKDKIDLGDPIIFEKTVKAAFSQRRKTLRNTLRNILSTDDFNSCKIDPNRRAETLHVEEFLRLSRLIANKSTPN